MRKRTALVDQRISRSQLGSGAPPVPALGLGAPVMEEPEEAPPIPKPISAPRPVEKTQERPKKDTRPGPPVDMPSPPDSPMEGPFIPPAAPEDDNRKPAFIPPVEDQEVMSSPVEPAIPSPSDATGASGLKRATSGETSRLRGPRGARGPRPAPGRVSSSTAVPAAGDEAANQSDGEAQKSGMGLKRGSRVHKAGSSVSQAIASYEGRG